VLGAMILEFFGQPCRSSSAAGAEFLFLDMDTPHTMETLKGLIAGCRGIGLCAIVRVPA